MAHVAYMVATQPITHPYTLTSRSQLKLTRFSVCLDIIYFAEN